MRYAVLITPCDYHRNTPSYWGHNGWHDHVRDATTYATYNYALYRCKIVAKYLPPKEFKVEVTKCSTL